MAERFVVWGCLGYAVCHCNSIDLHIVLPNNLRTHGDPHKAPKTQGLSQLSSSTGAALLSGACSTPAALQPWQEPFSTRIHSKHAGRLGVISNRMWSAGPPVSWPCDLGHWRACHHRRTLFCCLTCFTYPWLLRGFQMFQDEVLEVKLGLPLHWVDCHHFHINIAIFWSWTPNYRTNINPSSTQIMLLLALW
jgi:hypothetical protein